ncbi:MAG: lamin tail domain-containing protein, partial [Bacteroidota bacterium]
MRQNWMLVVTLLCVPLFNHGQVTIYQESMGSTGTNGGSISAHESNNNFDEDALTYSGSGDMRNTTVSSGYSGASGLFNILLNSVGEELTIEGIDLSLYTNIDLSYGVYKNLIAEDGSGIQIEYSNSGSGGPYFSVASPSIPTGSGTSGWYLRSSNTIPNTATTIRFKSNSSTSWRIDDLILEGDLLTSSTVDYANLQFPGTGNINRCNEFIVYAQVFESGVTPNAGASADIEAWIGINTSNTDPSTWSPTSWFPASYNSQLGNNDEYILNLGPELSVAGTYYYASRFRYDGGPFAYGGFSSGFWDGTTNVNGQVTVVNETAGFASVQSPYSGSINLCGNFDVYGRVFQSGVTEPAGQGDNITAWIGYNNISQTYDVTASTGWTWIEATYNGDIDNDDEYIATIDGSDLPPGEYYYASRFQINCNDFSYGGIRPDGIGNFWGLAAAGGIPYSGILTVNDPGSATVAISEIMYNSTGTDDDWIEICNVSGSNQDLSFYQIDVGGSVVYTFPCGTQIPNNDCITISLGDGGGTEYNVDCPFTPDYTNGLGTGTLNNTGDTITLFRGDGTTLVDSVIYDNTFSGANNNGSSLHVIDISQDNSITSSNWQEVELGGSSGVNSLIPNCLPNEAIILVEGNLGNYPDISNGDTTPSGLDNTLFSAQFVGGTQAKSYRILSLGLIDISISSINLSGDVADFTITTSPSSPITYGSPEVLEITFSPISAGIKTAIVQVFNNDTDRNPYTYIIQGEGICVSGSNSISPSSGPPGTVVSVIGSNLTSATAEFNGVPVTVNNVSDTEMELIIPNNAETGNISIFDDANCTSVFIFNVINNSIA